MGTQWSMSALARHLGVAPSTFSAYAKKGVIPSFDIGNGICDTLGIRPEWYLDGTGEMTAAPDSIRKSESAIDISNEILRDDEAEITEIGDVFGFRNSGEAMSPTIPNGARVLFSKISDLTEVEDACVYLLRVGKSFIIRRLQRDVSGGFIAVCDNQAFAVDRLGPKTVVFGKAFRVETDL